MYILLYFATTCHFLQTYYCKIAVVGVNVCVCAWCCLTNWDHVGCTHTPHTQNTWSESKSTETLTKIKWLLTILFLKNHLLKVLMDCSLSLLTWEALYYSWGIELFPVHQHDQNATQLISNTLWRQENPIITLTKPHLLSEKYSRWLTHVDVESKIWNKSCFVAFFLFTT